jgi:hypothetical protein
VKKPWSLWERLLSFGNLCRAAWKSARGKRFKAEVMPFHFALEKELCRLQEELERKTYRPGAYRTFEIREPKPRMISAICCGVVRRPMLLSQVHAVVLVWVASVEREFHRGPWSIPAEWTY